MKFQAQGETFVEELATLLLLIIGFKCIALTYVIWSIEADNFNASLLYEDSII